MAQWEVGVGGWEERGEGVSTPWMCFFPTLHTPCPLPGTKTDPGWRGYGVEVFVVIMYIIIMVTLLFGNGNKRMSNNV